jgi:hypothetical protein
MKGPITSARLAKELAQLQGVLAAKEEQLKHLSE